MKEEFYTKDEIKKFLFEHIIKGDATDGIPNIFSDDDTFINNTKRQKPIYQKKIDEWFINKNEFDKVIADSHYIRNDRLINLKHTPAEIKADIIKDLIDQSKKPNLLMDYLQKYNLAYLLEHYQEFI